MPIGGGGFLGGGGFTSLGAGESESALLDDLLAALQAGSNIRFVTLLGPRLRIDAYPSGSDGEIQFRETVAGESRFAATNRLKWDDTLHRLEVTGDIYLNGDELKPTEPAGAVGQVQWNAGGVPPAFGASANLFYDNANARLGIGTTTPQAALDVVTTTDAVARFYGGSGALVNVTGGSGYSSFELHVGSATECSMYQLGDNKLRLYGRNNVALGPALGAESVAFPIRYPVHLLASQSFSFPSLAWQSSDAAVGINLTSTNLAGSNSEVVFGCGTNGAGWMQFRTDIANPGFVINPAGGNVGIGIGTNAPQAALDVVGSVAITDGNAYLRLKDASNGVTFTDGANLLRLDPGGYVFLSSIYVLTLQATQPGFPGYIRIGADQTTFLDATLTNEWMRIDGTTGRVGIGTTSPQAALDVRGSALVAVPTGSTMDVWNGGALTLRVSDTGVVVTQLTAPQALDVVGGVRMGNANQTSFWLDPAGAVDIWNASNTTNPAFRAAANGRVGIGTQNPQAALHVYVDGSKVSDPVINDPTASVSILADAGGNHIRTGFYSSAPYPAWMQVTSYLGIPWNLVINPLGGNVGVGTQAPQAALDVVGEQTAPIISATTNGLGTLTITGNSIHSETVGSNFNLLITCNQLIYMSAAAINFSGRLFANLRTSDPGPSAGGEFWADPADGYTVKWAP